MGVFFFWIIITRVQRIESRLDEKKSERKMERIRKEIEWLRKIATIYRVSSGMYIMICEWNKSLGFKDSKIVIINFIIMCWPALPPPFYLHGFIQCNNAHWRAFSCYRIWNIYCTFFNIRILLLRDAQLNALLSVIVENVYCFWAI